MSDRTQIEYRICWEASSNVSFHGNTGWQDAKDWGETPEEVIDALHESDLARNGSLPHGLEQAMDACGFEWRVEAREAGEADE